MFMYMIRGLVTAYVFVLCVSSAARNYTSLTYNSTCDSITLRFRSIQTQLSHLYTFFQDYDSRCHDYVKKIFTSITPAVAQQSRHVLLDYELPLSVYWVWYALHSVLHSSHKSPIRPYLFLLSSVCFFCTRDFLHRTFQHMYLLLSSVLPTSPTSKSSHNKFRISRDENEIARDFYNKPGRLRSAFTPTTQRPLNNSPMSLDSPYTTSDQGDLNVLMPQQHDFIKPGSQYP